MARVYKVIKSIPSIILLLTTGCASGGVGEWYDGNASTGNVADAGPEATSGEGGVQQREDGAATGPGAFDAGPSAFDAGTEGSPQGGGGPDAASGDDAGIGTSDDGGTLLTCSVSSCASCCDQGTCVTTASDTQCGVSGAACQDCTASGETCNAGACAAPAPSDAGSTCSSPYAHNDGLNSITSTFSDCVPPTVDSALAQDECLHNSNQCSQTCPGSDGGGPSAWCGTGFYGCFCWSYAGPAKGTVGPTNCACPTPGGSAYY